MLIVKLILKKTVSLTTAASHYFIHHLPRNLIFCGDSSSNNSDGVFAILDKLTFNFIIISFLLQPPLLIASFSPTVYSILQPPDCWLACLLQ